MKSQLSANHANHFSSIWEDPVAFPAKACFKIPLKSFRPVERKISIFLKKEKQEFFRTDKEKQEFFRTD
ncbi:hypothetical protein MSBR2_0546 [Methanosarcina barkeri 227]|uniref:Uncharacterized protein n=1 Tax=Methanosarcina barkeri 227 TaxID=1434106 RepID=A0A0E3R0W3_METBA|nr:hypothetical protein MSBR2_0546 [Methanosarcina barkeri 227]